jgi:hypothetical protein
VRKPGKPTIPARLVGPRVDSPTPVPHDMVVVNTTTVRAWLLV